MKGWKLYRSTISRGSTSTQVPHSWYTHGSTPWQGSGRWWQSLVVVVVSDETQAVEPQEDSRPVLLSQVLPQCLAELSWCLCASTGWEGRKLGPSSSSRMLMLSPHTLKSGGSCPQNHKFDYFCHIFFTNKYDFWKSFYSPPWLRLAELDVELYAQTFFFRDWSWDFHCTLSLWSWAFQYQSQISSPDHGQLSQSCEQARQLSTWK